MIRLERDEYVRVRPLAGQPHLNLALDAMAEGNSPALIWVDDRAQPSAAYVWDRAHCHFLLGDASTPAFTRKVRELVCQEIAPQMVAQGKAFLKVHYSSVEWEQQIGPMFETAELIRRERVFYALDRFAKPDWRMSVPSGFSVRQIDVDLLATDRLRGIEILRNEIQTGWHSLEDFLRTGFGYCLLRNDEIVTWCTGEYVSDGKCGVGIETAVEHMRRGFGTITASAFVEHAVAKGITPHWDSWKMNLPSVAVAQKVGFRLISEYVVFTGRFQAAYVETTSL
jgi:hypothetical protein